MTSSIPGPLFSQRPAPPPPAPQQDRLDWTDPHGTNFRVPRLTDRGIETDGWCYIESDWAASGYTIRSATSVFRSDGKHLGYDQRWGDQYRFAATPANLELFFSLPFISCDQRTLAAELYQRWVQTLPHTTFTALGLKALAEPAGDDWPLHRVVRTRKIEFKLVKRDMTPAERMTFMITGAKPQLESVEEVITSHPVPDVDIFQQYSARRLFSQQLIGAWAIILCKKLGVFFDMRVGKTDTAIVAGRHSIAVMGDAKLVVVVAPKNNLYDPWAPNLSRLGFDVHILDGSDEEDELACAEAAAEAYHGTRPTAIVLNDERIISRFDSLERHFRFEDMFLVMDETSAIKNPTASRTKAAHLLSARAAYVVLLNGTPMEQGPQDLWAQLRCLDPHGVVTGLNYIDWLSTYLTEVAPGKFRVKPDEGVRRAFEMMLTTLSIRYIRSEADQFGGKDKNFRYIKIKPTAQMAKQARNIIDGYVDTVAPDGTKKYTSMSECILAVYGALREVSCGYDKYRDEEGGPYFRVRHKIDPKLLWVRAFLEANPTEPLVLAVNFNEQEQAAKEMLNDMGIRYSSSRPAAKRTTHYRIKQLVPDTVWNWMVDRYGSQRIHGMWPTNGTHGGIPLVEVPTNVRFDAEVVEGVRQRFYYGSGWTEEYYTFVEQEYTSAEKAQQREAFNRGDTHVYICKVAEMRGFSLSRVEAVANGIGTYPTIVFTSPPWSLGMWDQAQDRCVGIDPSTNKNICTMIYALVCPGMEDAIMKALRSKKEVQAELLKDAERVGYQSFVENLVSDMETAAAEGAGDGEFDTEEMFARIACGVPPAAKLTERNVLNKIIEKHGKRLGFKNRGDVLRWLQQEVEPLTDDMKLDPDILMREGYFTLSRYFEKEKA